MSVFGRLSRVSRERKLETFFRIVEPLEGLKLLDLGAQINPGRSDDLQLIDVLADRRHVTAANISPEHVERIRGHYPEVEAVVADACDLPWPDGTFDIVYSNAVIEHVGDRDAQKRMAQEIMRVGKRWFVTTPNRWFPFEFHLRLPLVTWLPGRLYLTAGRVVSYNHVRERYVFNAGPHRHLNLLSARDLAACFPGSHILRQRVTFMAETLIAIDPVSAERLKG